MNKFKIGDKVRVTRVTIYAKVGDLGIISHIDYSDNTARVRLINGSYKQYWLHLSVLELVKDKVKDSPKEISAEKIQLAMDIMKMSSHGFEMSDLRDLAIKVLKEALEAK